MSDQREPEHRLVAVFDLDGFSRVVWKYCEDHRLSPRQLADRAGLQTKPVQSLVEFGSRRRVALTTVAAIAVVCDLSLDRFVRRHHPSEVR